MKIPALYFATISLLLCIFASVGWALPTYQRTALPLPKTIPASDKQMIREVLKLEVYQDDKDPSKYYYVPPFHARTYAEGAGGMLLHVHNINAYADAKNELRLREKLTKEYWRNRLAELEEQIVASEGRVNLAMERYEAALAKGHQFIIDFYKRALQREQDGFEKEMQWHAEAKKNVSKESRELPGDLGKDHFSQAIRSLSSTGLDVSIDIDGDPKAVEIAILGTIQKLAATYGGFMSLNVYGGFTQEQMDLLAAYREKYAPSITIALLPVRKLNFFPLTEWQSNPDKQSTSTAMFTNIKGSGDYLGAAVVMDLSIAGSEGLAQHLGPFVLPIGVRAEYLQAIEPTEAELICDFSTGYAVTGRADIRDGLVIYDNDITNGFKTEDLTSGACNVKLLKGNIGSADYLALKEMEKYFEDMRINRINMAHAEKRAYYESLLADLAKNRRIEKESARFGQLDTLIRLDWQDVAIEAFSEAADFHWHTSIQNSNTLSSVNFKKRLSTKGHEVIERDFPTNICLVYNPVTKSYDRCTNLEEKSAKNMQPSIVEATASKDCAGVSSPFECGKLRDAAGTTSRQGDQAPRVNGVL